MWFPWRFWHTHMADSEGLWKELLHCLIFSYSNLNITYNFRELHSKISKLPAPGTDRCFHFRWCFLSFSWIAAALPLSLTYWLLGHWFSTQSSASGAFGIPTPCIQSAQIMHQGHDQRLCFRVGPADLSSRVAVIYVPLTLDPLCFPW